MANEVSTVVGAALMASQVILRLFKTAAYQAAITIPLIMNIPLGGQASDTVKVPKLPKLTATAQTQGVDMANTPYAPTSTTMTCGLAGLMVTLLDTFMSSDIIGNPAVYAEQLGQAVAEKIETDALGQAADFVTSVGTTTVNLAPSDVLSAIYELILGKAVGPYVGVLHPIQKHDLRSAILASASAIWGAGSGPAGLVAEPGMPEVFFNVVWFESTGCASVNADADRQGFVAPFGQASGLAYAEKWGPRVEAQRDASKVGDELVGTAYYAVECVDTSSKGGVKIISDHE